MKIVFKSKLIKDGEQEPLADAELCLHGKDMRQAFDKIESFSYSQLAADIHIPNGYHLDKLVARLLDGRKILAEKPISDSDKKEKE